MHTADWNLCVIKKAITLLQHCVLSFEELHNIRIAYATYEAADMKGLKLEKRTLLRTLKLVDFETLLSHQDERRSRALDERYLAEEWDFGRERLGSKHMFKGEVVYTEARIQQVTSRVNVADRPHIQDYVRVQTPRVVTPNELDEVQLKIATLQFDIFTLSDNRFEPLAGNDWHEEDKDDDGDDDDISVTWSPERQWSRGIFHRQHRVTVTIKDKTHHVDNTSLSEAAQGLGNAEEFSDGRFYSPPFAGSPPYSTSTPRRANSPVKLSNRKKIRKENDNLMNHYQQNGGHVFDDHTAQSAVNKLSLLAELTDSANIATQNHAGEPKPQIGSENDDEDVSNEEPKAEAENTNTEEQNGNNKYIQFAPDTLDTKPRSVRPSLQSQSSTERLLRQKEFDLDGDTPRKFSFNKVTTRRLLRRVKEDISQELMTRIRTGDTGLKVV
nr:hypothetical protein BaRGS_002463 [Batillaria attramentaria]